MITKKFLKSCSIPSPCGKEITTEQELEMELLGVDVITTSITVS